MSGPLTGMRVMDFTRALAGPHCTLLLADMGAEVIKIERVKGGDEVRRMGPPFINGESAAFMASNRNKKSVTVDLKDPRGREICVRLAKWADVLVENFRPGVMKGLGLDYPTLSQVNPRLIYCSISGFGQTGPMANQGGYDTVAQGMGGIMMVTGVPGGPPVKAGVPIIDLGTGMFGALGVLAAYIARQQTGKGQHIDTSLLDSSVALGLIDGSDYLASGDLPMPLASAHRRIAPHGAFKTRDGYITIAADSAPTTWKNLCQLLGKGEMETDPRLVDNTQRRKNLPFLIEQIEAATTTRESTFWLEKLQAAGIPCGPVNNYDKVFQHPQVLARDLLVENVHPKAGRVKMVGKPIKFSDTPATDLVPSAALGEHTTAILQSLGYSADEVEQLRQEKVI
ncbi:MAG: CoA transferase [Deltaproteobacteria bacterium]|nr:CoA transferase [Deltaproteobacteria bacterium]